MGEFLRRVAAPFRPNEDEKMLEGMIEQMVKTTAQASAAIDDALAKCPRSGVDVGRAQRLIPEGSQRPQGWPR